MTNTKTIDKPWQHRFSLFGKDTTYLVVGKNVGASKLKKAETYGTEQIDETTLLKMIGV